MSNQVETQGHQASQVRAGGVARRRLLRAGLAAAPVSLAVSGRSAMATVSTSSCPKGLSPLAWNSLTKNGTQANCMTPSHNVGTNPLGRSPGYWKPTSNANGNCNVSSPGGPTWPAVVVPYEGYTGASSVTFSGGLSNAAWATGTKFNSVFVGSSDSRSFSRILIDSPGTLESHLCAAYLNALTVNDYALTAKEVLEAAAGKIGSTTIFSQSVIKDYLNSTWS
jgi:hypothetical protein